jgi:hypothetical protein
MDGAGYVLVSQCSSFTLYSFSSLRSIPKSRFPPHSKSRSTYLILHNALFEPRSTHSNLPRLLAPTPNALVIRRLLRPHALRIRHILLQHLVERALGRGGGDVGLGNIGLGAALDGVVGGLLVGLLGRGGDVANRGADGAGRAEGADEHFGGLGVQADCQLLWGAWAAGVDVKLSSELGCQAWVSQRHVPARDWSTCYIHQPRFGLQPILGSYCSE